MEVKKTSLFKKPKVRKTSFAKRKISNLEDDDDEGNGDGRNEQSGTIFVSGGIDTNHDSQQNRDNPNHPLPTTVKNHDSILQKIQSIKKSRKIKDQIRTRGLGAALTNGQNHQVSLKKLKTVEADEGSATLHGQEQDALEEAEAIANQDLKQRLEGNFAIKGCNTNEEDGNILMQKHKLAMEEYIQGQIIKDAKDDGDMQQNTTHDNINDGECNEEPLLQVKNTNDLYSKILQDAKQQLQSTQYESNKSVATAANGTIMEDSDIGAGGAMLGGTGIAEVALPVEERIKAARETELAAARMERKRMKKRYGGGGGMGDLESDEMDKMESSYETMLPTSFGAGPGKQRRNRNAIIKHPSQQDEHQSNILAQQSDSSTHRRDPVLSRVLHKNSMPGIGSSYSHNFRLHNDEWIQKQKQQQHLLQDEEKRMDPMKEQDEVDDSNRIGFEARKRRKDHPKLSDKANSGGKKKVERAHDDVVYKKFVTRELQNIRR